MEVGIASDQPKPANQKVASLSAKQSRSAVQHARTEDDILLRSSSDFRAKQRQRRRGQLRVDVALSQDDIQDCSRDR